jgi:hypothetical protein
MPDQITITGVAPYDGRYELDITGQPLTTREWGWVKRHAGYLPLTMDTSSFADPEFVIVEAVIALHRAGRIQPAEVAALVERFQDIDPFTAITYQAGEPEGDADPPPRSSDVKPSSNGDSSTTGSATSDSIPTATGPPPSDTSLSDLSMSVS